MYKLVVGVAALLALGRVGPANAADMPVKAAPKPLPSAMSWTGCYLSAGAGYGMRTQERTGETFPGAVPLTSTFSSGGQGWLGRVGVGCDYQFAPSFVVGAFGDYDFMDLKTANFAEVAGLGARDKESRAWAAGVRLGYLPYPALMTFISGGWTQARFDRQDMFVTAVVPAAPAGAVIDAHTYNGAFIGSGFEYRLPWWQNVALKTEYRFNWYRAADLPIVATVGPPTAVGEHIKNTVQTVTTSLVWRFDSGAHPALNASPAASPAVVSWTGCYLSGGAGYGMRNQERRLETFPTAVALSSTGSNGGQGWLGRAGLGCDYQFAPQVVAGIFADYDFMNLKSTNFVGVTAISSADKESRAWAAGARLGYLPYPNLMSFLSGGWTQARFDRQDLFVTVVLPPIRIAASIDAHTYNGAFVGGGFEYRLPWWQNVAWKTEYRFNWYGAADLPILGAGGAPSVLGENIKNTVQTVTTSLVWRFDSARPLVQ